jgi:hypothetical protein
MMKAISTTLILSALGVALLGASASAQMPQRQSLDQQIPYGENPARDDVVLNGRVVGRDPDRQIRSQLSREWDSLQAE